MITDAHAFVTTSGMLYEVNILPPLALIRNVTLYKPTVWVSRDND